MAVIWRIFFFRENSIVHFFLQHIVDITAHLKRYYRVNISCISKKWADYLIMNQIGLHFTEDTFERWKTYSTQSFAEAGSKVPICNESADDLDNGSVPPRSKTLHERSSRKRYFFTYFFYNFTSCICLAIILRQSMQTSTNAIKFGNSGNIVTWIKHGSAYY